jgi:hypothetical protein
MEAQCPTEEGEPALSRGNTRSAESAFHAAARRVRAPDIEMRLVRTCRQAVEHGRPS